MQQKKPKTKTEKKKAENSPEGKQFCKCMRSRPILFANHGAVEGMSSNRASIYKVRQLTSSWCLSSVGRADDSGMPRYGGVARDPPCRPNTHGPNANDPYLASPARDTSCTSIPVPWSGLYLRNRLYNTMEQPTRSSRVHSVLVPRTGIAILQYSIVRPASCYFNTSTAAMMIEQSGEQRTQPFARVAAGYR